jgi:hypothetical protein
MIVLRNLLRRILGLTKFSPLTPALSPLRGEGARRVIAAER